MQIGYTVNVNLFRGALMVKIITDSASDFEPNELKELMIDCIPLSVNFGDEEYKDNVTISKDEFFDKLKNTTETVKTSQPSLHDIVGEFEAAEHSKDGGVAIFMSSKISGTANTAQMQKVCKLFFNLHTLFYKLRCSNKNSTLLFSHKLTKSKRLYFVKKRNKRDYKSNNINAIFCKYYKFRGVLI